MSIFRRRQFLVEKRLQSKVAWQATGFLLFNSIIMGLAIFFTTYMILAEKITNVYPSSQVTLIFRNVYMALVGVILLFLPLMYYASIVFSHRVAGPLPKIHQALRQIGNGNYEINLILRKNDILKDLATTINQMARHLKEREAKK